MKVEPFNNFLSGISSEMPGVQYKIIILRTRLSTFCVSTKLLVFFNQQKETFNGNSENGHEVLSFGKLYDYPLGLKL